MSVYDWTGRQRAPCAQCAQFAQDAQDAQDKFGGSCWRCLTDHADADAVRDPPGGGAGIHPRVLDLRVVDGEPVFPLPLVGGDRPAFNTQGNKITCTSVSKSDRFLL